VAASTLRPIVAAQGVDADGTWQIISGYRRYVAQLLAYGVREWADREPEGGLTLTFVVEIVLKMIAAFGRKPASTNYNGSSANGAVNRFYLSQPTYLLPKSALL
jgi:hypothetical protein